MVKASKVKSLLGAILLLTGVFFTFYGGVAFFSISLIVAGLVLLLIKTRSDAKALASETPAGVIAVAVPTLFGSFILGFLTMLYFALSGVGSFGISVGLTAFGWFVIFASALLGLVGFGGSIALLRGNASRYLWYVMVAFWIAIFAFSSLLGYTVVWRQIGEWFIPNRQVDVWQYEEMLVTVLPLVYSLGCLLYFQKARVKEYFHVNRISNLKVTV